MESLAPDSLRGIRDGRETDVNTSHQVRSGKYGSYFRARSGLLALVVALIAGHASHLAQAQSYQVLYSFGGLKDGANPYGGLVRDTAGNIYGTTIYGGRHRDLHACLESGCGVAFRLDTAGKETVLYSFDGDAGGTEPFAGLIRDSHGNLYGVTGFGGDPTCKEQAGCGAIFEIDAAGQGRALYNFKGGEDGARPMGALVRDSAGYLYGTTWQGGAANSGTVFKLDAAGNETVLYAFRGKADGGSPLGTLIRDSRGNLYGTTEFGGDLNGACGTMGCGVVFEIKAEGGETVLYRFTGGADGSQSSGSLVGDSVGNLYGTTGLGGDLSCNAPSGCGVVFKLDSAGVETVLHSFTGASTDGWNPIAGVVRDASGNLYGTTYRGGAHGYGTIFKLDAKGNESLLYSFGGGSDGGYPYAGLILDGAGNLYGAAAYNGESGCSGEGCGVVFKLVP
jgi:uncharacterized repeat protein (TIGR03803 family)